METQIARAVPTEDGFDVECATQWQNGIQLSCAHILGWDCNRINVRTARIGGSFGGKAKTSLLTGSIAVIASYITGRTVRFHSTLSQCMETYGSRPAYVVDYTVGFNDCGLLDVIEATYFTNSGVSANDSDLRAGALKSLADGGYRCSNWNLTSRNVKTNIPSNAWCRAPMSAQLSAVMEIILEHVAKSLKEDPIKIKIRNLYKENEVELFGTTLEHFKLREISEALLASANAAERQLEHDAFNRKNKWKKRGMGFMPMKFPVTYQARWFSTQVSILSNDGTVILTCGGADCGQGLSTKLIQVASFVLGVPMDLIRVAESSLVTTPNSSATSSSITSELCCVGILECCKTLKSRLTELKATMNLSDDIPWRNLIKKCFAQGVNLTANHWVFPKKDPVKRYHVCGAALSEVELDVLTGEYALRRVDILYDCGKSINPEIDIGQAEGAFMMGVGFYTSEKMSYDSITGKLVTNNTWQYKPPASKDIPTVWNITFVKDESNPAEILSSKAVGEPPLCLSASVIFAMKRCVENFKRDKSYFPIDLPATVDNVQQLCEIALTDYTIYD